MSHGERITVHSTYHPPSSVYFPAKRGALCISCASLESMMCLVVATALLSSAVSGHHTTSVVSRTAFHTVRIVFSPQQFVPYCFGLPLASFFDARDVVFEHHEFIM